MLASDKQGDVEPTHVSHVHRRARIFHEACMLKHTSRERPARGSLSWPPVSSTPIKSW